MHLLYIKLLWIKYLKYLQCFNMMYVLALVGFSSELYLFILR